MNMNMDPKGSKRKYLAQMEINKQLSRYKKECRDLGVHPVTEEEKNMLERSLHKTGYSWEELIKKKCRRLEEKRD